MDIFDRRILRILQSDASATVAEISAKVGLSTTPSWKRIQKLEAAGVIRRRVALVAPEKVGLHLRVHVAIQAGEHGGDAMARFMAAVSDMPEVVEFNRMAGEVDFSLCVMVQNLPAYDDFYRRLTALMPLKNVTSHVVLQSIKATTELPIADSSSHDAAPV